MIVALAGHYFVLNWKGSPVPELRVVTAVMTVLVAELGYRVLGASNSGSDSGDGCEK